MEKLENVSSLVNVLDPLIQAYALEAVILNAVYHQMTGVLGLLQVQKL